MALHEYNCPCCGGDISYDSNAQQLKCPYCDTEFAIETLEALNAETSADQADSMQWDTDAGGEWSGAEANGMRRYSCTSCGAEIFGDETLAATRCPYCDSVIVMMDQFEGVLRPDYVIPFRLNKEAAKKALLEHYSGKKLLPRVFRDANHIDELKGVYVPFWMFNAEAQADMRYRATRVRHWSDRDFDYTETSFYSVIRSGTLDFANVPTDGSTKMPNDLMESLEPFDMSEAVDFKTAYLAGYLADKYDISAEDSVERANARIRNTTENVFARTVNGYSSVQPEHSRIALNHAKAKYVLLPVWLLNTSWEGKKYTFAMNGQTGKFIGDLPMDNNAAMKMTLKTAGIVGAAVFAASYLLQLL